MKTLSLSLLVALSLISGLSAVAETSPVPNSTVQTTTVSNKLLQSALHRIEENSNLVLEYARIYEWDNVDNEVDRIVAAEKKVYKAYSGVAEKQSQREALSVAVKELRGARFQRNVDRALAAATKVKAAASDLLK